MSGFAAIINWDRRPVSDTHLRYMLEMIRHRGPDGLVGETRQHIGFGHAKFLLHDSCEGARNPVWLPDSSAGITGDIRLYDRTDLFNRVKFTGWLPPKPTDAELVLAGFEIMEEDVFTLLNGDFSVVIDDRRRDRIVAARDPFGLKPLFYYAVKNRLLLASEQKQILTQPGIPLEVDDIVIGEFLLNNFEERDRTFFSRIRRIRPGHYLIASKNALRQQRYWLPETLNKIRLSDENQYFDTFREHLKQSVQDRLDRQTAPAAVLLSGGLDSTSIVSLADELVRARPGRLPPIHLLSATFSDPECDESSYITALAAKLSFPAHQFRAGDESDLEGIDEDFHVCDSPNIEIQRLRLRQTARIAKELGARTIYTGIGGDEVLTEYYFLVDLAKRHRYRQLIACCRDMSRIFRDTSFYRYLSTALLQTVPGFVRRSCRAVIPAPAWRPPNWFTDDFARRYTGFPEVRDDHGLVFTSRMQQATFDNFVDPYYHWGLENWECRDAHAGFESRHPFLDRRLVEYVLRVPFEVRTPPEGRWKYLLRRGMESRLPTPILERKQKTAFDAYLCGLLHYSLPIIRERIFGEQTWLSEPYIRKDKVEPLLSNYHLSGKSRWASQARPIWAITALELWLRQLYSYSSIQLK